jgi:alkylated DNA nucleotide flippase Atl1
MPLVDNLFIKALHAMPVQTVSECKLLVGEGIDGDAARSLSSPRQVLIVRKEDLDEFNLPIGYLKENLVISGLSRAEFQPGKMLHFEGGSSIHIAFYCEPCKSIGERVQSLKSIVGRRGVMGVVTKSGNILAGAHCMSESSELQAMSAIAGERVMQVVSRIPSGKVLDYATLLTAAGLQRAYFRVIPTYLKKARANGLPAHRVVTSRFEVPSFMVDRVDELAGELGVKNLGDASLLPHCLLKFLWQPKALEVLVPNPLLTSPP